MREVTDNLTPEPIKAWRRKFARFAAWLTGEFARSPRWALFCRRLGQKNRRYFERVQKEAALGHEALLEPYYDIDIPRIIWIYWNSGETDAPEIVRYCIESWRKHNPDWDVRVLDAEEAWRLGDLSVFDGKDFPQRYHANLLRLQILSTHRGVWADATLLCHRPLDSWLPLACPTGFFSFTDAGPDRLVESWFIASAKGGQIVKRWRDTHSAEVGKLKRPAREYFIVMYAFEWALRSSAGMREAWAVCPRVPALRCLLFVSALLGKTDRSVVVRALRNGLPVSKLSWKADFSVAVIDDVVKEACSRPA